MQLFLGKKKAHAGVIVVPGLVLFLYVKSQIRFAKKPNFESLY